MYVSISFACIFFVPYMYMSLLFFLSPHLYQLWMSIFSNDELVQFSYLNFSLNKGIGTQEVQLLQASATRTGGEQLLAIDEEFECQFPFFWLIKEAIESKWEPAKNTSGTGLLVKCLFFHLLAVLA